MSHLNGTLISGIFHLNSETMQKLSFRVRHLPLKRTFDVIFSLLCLLLGFPVFLLIALLIYIHSPGPIFYAHSRIGRGGKSFRCYKFRTMYLHSEERLASLLKENPCLKREWETHYKLKNDPRVFWAGKWLRKTSLDELPQFWNVLKGDLSIVGPRPVVEEEIQKFFGNKAEKILSIRPGLTGIWQVSGRSDTPCYKTRIAIDEYYVDHLSFFLDLKLIAQTVPAMIHTRGAY